LEARHDRSRLADVVCTGLAVAGRRAAHATTTAIVRIELTDNRLHYALSVVLPEIPNRSAELLTSAVNGDRPAAERIAEYARQTLSVELGSARCRMGRVRIGVPAPTILAPRSRSSSPVTSRTAASRLRGLERASGRALSNVGKFADGNGERQVSFEEPSRKVTIDVDRPVATGWFDFVKLASSTSSPAYDHLLFLARCLQPPEVFGPSSASSLRSRLRIA